MWVSTVCPATDLRQQRQSLEGQLQHLTMPKQRGYRRAVEGRIAAIDRQLAPSAKSIAERLPKDFRFVSTTRAGQTALRLDGTLECRDELDAVTEALAAMRDFLTELSRPPTETE